MKRVWRLVLFLSLAPSVGVAENVRSIAAVNAPLASIARALGGPDVEVIYPVPADVDPAFWEPSPEAVQRIQDAELILLNGAGYAGWIATAVLPRARMVDTTSAVRDQLIPADTTGTAHKHGPGGEHAHAGRYAFTTWLDPTIALAQVETVADALARRWPELAPAIDDRAEALRRDIRAMDDAFRTFSLELSDRQVFASHPVYQYFERAYRRPMTSLHWEPDADPSEQDWSAFRATLEPNRSPVMIWEGTPLRETSERLARLGVDHVVLSPMGNSAQVDNMFQEIANQVK